MSCRAHVRVGDGVPAVVGRRSCSRSRRGEGKRSCCRPLEVDCLADVAVGVGVGPTRTDRLNCGGATACGATTYDKN